MYASLLYLLTIDIYLIYQTFNFLFLHFLTQIFHNISKLLPVNKTITILKSQYNISTSIL